MELGKNIEKYRKAAGLSREKLAVKCAGKFTSIHLMRIEKGAVKNPGIEIVKAIADALKVSLDKLVQ